MARFLSLTLLVLLLAGISGLNLSGDGDRCADRCPGEKQSGQCPPDCASCPCCASARPVLLQLVATPSTPEISGVAPVESSPSQSIPDPHEIFHVPRSSS